MNERYSIEVNEDCVVIYGDLTIEETFDFLNFFDRKGYKSVVIGTDNSTLRLIKKGQEEVVEEQHITDLKDQIEECKILFKTEQEKHDLTKSRLKYTESLIKVLMQDSRNLVSTEQNQEFYEKLLKLKKDFPNLELPRED